MTSIFAANLLSSDGWKVDQKININAQGLISSITDSKPEHCHHQAEFIIPGFINTHSHAFQWSMAGLAESFGKVGDSFWSWRELMYQFVQKIQPEDLLVIAEALYIDMLKAGYTEVGEFHYLHKTIEGESYSQPELLSLMVIEAAQKAGIAICHLPVLYQQSGFNQQPLNQFQQRFGLELDEYLLIQQNLNKSFALEPLVNIGLAPHSLRAVDLSQLSLLLKNTINNPPIHIHIAEQLAEVDQALNSHGLRPVDYLYENLAVKENWCLVHATHISSKEIKKIAKSGATVALCPTTEANLGDGIFPLMEFKNASGRWGIGSDSHISVDPREELRLLEYGQRLMSHNRAVYSNRKQPETATNLIIDSQSGGMQALQSAAGMLEPGKLANLLSLKIPSYLKHYSAEALTSKWIFSSRENWINEVMVSGHWVIKDGQHQEQDNANKNLQRVLKKLSYQ